MTALAYVVVVPTLLLVLPLLAFYFGGLFWLYRRYAEPRLLAWTERRVRAAGQRRWEKAVMHNRTEWPEGVRRNLFPSDPEEPVL